MVLKWRRTIRSRLLHVLRAPVGGLFRHVVDLARGQAALGHQVGIVANSSTGGGAADATLSELSHELALGLTRLPMSRHIDWSDVEAVADVAQRVTDSGADVVHGHGAKGGAYARLAKQDHAIRVYTPHGGSLHYRWLSPVGCLYLTFERALMRRTDLLLFESAYGRDTFRAKIGEPTALVRVVHNGVTPAEFAAVEPGPDATDLLFIGELRALKGIDVLIDAIALVARDWRAVTATIVGEGPDRNALEAKVAGAQARRCGPLRRRDAGARRVRARSNAGRSVARRIPALHRARGRSRHRADDRDLGRRHPGNLRPGCRKPRAAGRCGRARTGDHRGALPSPRSRAPRPGVCACA